MRRRKMTFSGKEVVALHQCALRYARKLCPDKAGPELQAAVVDAMHKIYSEVKEVGSVRKVLEKYGCEDLIEEYGITR
jgi:hypothetical protein